MTELSKSDGKIVLLALKNARARAYGFNFPFTQGEVDAVIDKIKDMVEK